jgi:hypothetical protein
VKLVFTALIIVGALSGIYRFALAGYGWFQMSGVVDDTASKELPAMIERIQQAGGASYFSGGDGYVKIRESILRGAEEAKVPLRRDDVSVAIVDNMLDVRLSWDAPMVVYNGKAYLEIPMSMQRRFSLAPRRGY